MHTFVIRILFWFIFLSCGAGTAWAQFNVSAKSAAVSTPQVRAELVAHAPDGVQTGKTFWLGLQLQHTREWHTYWRNPGDSGLPTQLEFKLPPGLEIGPVIWPLPQKLSAGTLTNYGFDGDALLAVAVKVTSAYRAPSNGQLPLQLHANWLVCRLECIPQEGDFALQLPTQSSFAPQAKSFTALLQRQPIRLTAPQKAARFEGDFLVATAEGLPAQWVGQKLSVFPIDPDLLESSTDQHALAEQSWQGTTWSVRLPVGTVRSSSPAKINWLLTTKVGDVHQGVELVLPVAGAWPSPKVQAQALAAASANKVASPAPPAVTEGGAFGFILALAGALLGGLILNAMPCVLPILAIKLLGFTQHGTSKQMRRLTGTVYTVGVVASFLALGGAVLLLRTMGEQLGWGFQLQTPAVVAALAVLFTLIALNLWDVFSLGNVLPPSLASLQSRHPVVDALLSGVLAVAVASPCTAPFMGASLGVAMTMPAWQALSVFACMGLGLALPFLLASWVPAVAQALPKPGAWMATLRHALAFPMIATVIWLVWVFGLQTSVTKAMLLLGGLLLVALMVWASRFKTVLARTVQVLGLVAMGWIGLEVLANTNAVPQETQAGNATVSADTQTSNRWQNWSATAVQAALDQGHPVFVDFTAAWCVTCQINKQTTLNQPDVLADFADKQVRLMRADWTRRDPAISRALSELGRSGVPVYVLYAPNRAPQVLSELLSVGQVREALAQLQPTTVIN